MKKRILLISISFVLVILSLFLLFTKLNNKVLIDDNDMTVNKSTNTIKDTTTKDNNPITITDKGSKTEDNNKEKEINNNSNINNNTDTNKTNNRPNNNNSNINNNSNSTPVNSPPPITYSCPDGFNLQGQECIQNIDATATCPNNMINIDPGCIIFSEKVESSDGNTCPDGYYGLTEIHIDGTPDEFYCHPIHNKIYTCPDGYNLNNTNCTKQVPATKN